MQEQRWEICGALSYPGYVFWKLKITYEASGLNLYVSATLVLSRT